MLQSAQLHIEKLSKNYNINLAAETVAGRGGKGLWIRCLSANSADCYRDVVYTMGGPDVEQLGTVW